MIFNNKKAQGMSTSTIILLILGLIVLVVLALGFMMGWERFGVFAPKSNVDQIVQACESACLTQSKYDYCSSQRILKDENKNKIESSCAVFASVNEFSKYGIKECNIECNLECGSILINKIPGNPELSSGTYDVSSLSSESACFIDLK